MAQALGEGHVFLAAKRAGRRSQIAAGSGGSGYAERWDRSAGRAAAALV